MVLTHPFYCPTRTIEGHAFDAALFETLAGRRWALVTSPGWTKRGAVEKLISRCGNPVGFFDNCQENPTTQTVLNITPSLKEAEVYVALGGGSTIDALKGAATLVALNHDTNAFLEHLKSGVDLPQDLPLKPIITIPTTSGSGSEVTPWGTIWGEESIKYSVKNSGLYPTHAILDPELTVSMPAELTVATGLDALSHAMESVWNRRHTAITDAMASQAIRLLRNNLQHAVTDPENRETRRQIQTASTLAGFAMGTTQTALAHSISYPFTSRFGVPHGLACSFTLAEIARYNMEQDAERLSPIAEGMGCSLQELPTELEIWLDHLNLPQFVLGYISPEVTDTLGDNVITRARAANNIREIEGPKARKIARKALDRLAEVISV